MTPAGANNPHLTGYMLLISRDSDSGRLLLWSTWYLGTKSSSIGVTQPIDGPGYKPSRVSQNSARNPTHDLSSETSDHETEARHDLDTPNNDRAHPSCRQDAYAVNKLDRRKNFGYARKASRGSLTSLTSEDELPHQTNAQGARSKLS